HEASRNRKTAIGQMEVSDPHAEILPALKTIDIVADMRQSSDPTELLRLWQRLTTLAKDGGEARRVVSEVTSKVGGSDRLSDVVARMQKGDVEACNQIKLLLEDSDRTNEIRVYAITTRLEKNGSSSDWQKCLAELRSEVEDYKNDHAK